MPTTVKTHLKEETFAITSYELILNCGKCTTGQLVATNKPTQEGETIHRCTHCGRELSMSGEAYPRTVIKKVPVNERVIIHSEEVPDKDPDLYDQTEVSLLPQDKKVELLLSTRNPVIVDHLERATIQFLHHTLDNLLEVLFDMAREAARLRARGIPAHELEAPLTMKAVNELPFSEVVALIERTNRQPDNVDLIRNKNFGVVYDEDFRKALYSAAREVVTYRAKQSEKTTSAPEAITTPVKNKGGRPRKQVAIA